jgi:glycosyltransferase involved in cell wall biosynthesis
MRCAVEMDHSRARPDADAATPAAAEKAGAVTPHLAISVVVPAYNAAHYLERSLAPLMAMREQGEVAEVLLIDDCSTDPASRELAERLGARVIVMERNGGPGGARNRAAELACGDILWFVDADVVASPSSPARIRAAFEDPGVWAVFGSYDCDPPATNFASQYKNLVHRYYHQRGRSEASTFWAGCGAVRRKHFLALGGFSDGTYARPSIEDIELGQRMRDAGGRIRLMRELECTHLKRWSLKDLVRTDIFQRALPWSRLLLSSPRKVDELNVSGAEKVRALLAALWAVSLLCLPASNFHPAAVAAALAVGLAVAAVSASLLGYFARLRGVGFAILGVLYHQVYYLYSLAAYVWCVLERAANRMRARTLRRRAP